MSASEARTAEARVRSFAATMLAGHFARRWKESVSPWLCLTVAAEQCAVLAAQAVNAGDDDGARLWARAYALLEERSERGRAYATARIAQRLAA